MRPFIMRMRSRFNGLLDNVLHTEVSLKYSMMRAVGEHRLCEITTDERMRSQSIMVARADYIDAEREAE